MTELSIMIEAQDGRELADLAEAGREVEALGFAGLFRSDHYTNPQPPQQRLLEMIVS